MFSIKLPKLHKSKKYMVNLPFSLSLSGLTLITTLTLVLYPYDMVPGLLTDSDSILCVELPFRLVLLRVKFAGDLKLFASFLLAEII
jgi:hypothetical protein